VVTIVTTIINALVTIAPHAAMAFVPLEQIVEVLVLSTVTATAHQTVSTVFPELVQTTWVIVAKFVNKISIVKQI